MGLGNGIGSGTMMTLGADLAPAPGHGEFLGVWRLIGDVGSTGGPLVVGALADAVGLALAAFGLAGVGVLAGVHPLLFVHAPAAPAPAPARAPARGSAGQGAGGGLRRTRRPRVRGRRTPGQCLRRGGRPVG